jgi:2-polyprenyl-6-methoxyphenol hydroxylase-like FAD-dependent oxidoreductase
MILTSLVGSNGASQAILDVEALTNALLKHVQDPNTYRTIYDIPAALKTYENERLPLTAKIVMVNRASGPDRVMQTVEEKAPQGFKNIHDVIPLTVLEDMDRRYKAVSGAEIDKVNQRAKDTEGQADSLSLKSPKNWIAGLSNTKS